jgi:hypothetical protein
MVEERNGKQRCITQKRKGKLILLVVEKRLATQKFDHIGLFYNANICIINHIVCVLNANIVGENTSR